jgi:hypothetical protein
MSVLATALRDFVSLFERLEAPYVLMGGFAVRVYGIPRPTYDVDFTIAITRQRLPELYRAISESGYTVPEPDESGWVDQVAGMPLVKSRLFFEGSTIDIDIFLAESAFQDELLARRKRQQVDDLPVWLVSPEDLILLKLIASRPRDLVDCAKAAATPSEATRRPAARKLFPDTTRSRKPWHVPSAAIFPCRLCPAAKVGRMPFRIAAGRAVVSDPARRALGRHAASQASRRRALRQTGPYRSRSSSR